MKARTLLLTSIGLMLALASAALFAKMSGSTAGNAPARPQTREVVADPPPIHPPEDRFVRKDPVERSTENLLIRVRYDGQPVANATIVHEVALERFHRPRSGSVLGTTDSQGVLVPPGSSLAGFVTASAEGHLPASRAITWPETTIELPRSRSLHLQCQLRDGTPVSTPLLVSGAPIDLRSVPVPDEPRPSKSSRTAIYSLNADGNGDARIDEFPALDRIFVQALAEDFSLISPTAIEPVPTDGPLLLQFDPTVGASAQVSDPLFVTWAMRTPPEIAIVPSVLGEPLTRQIKSRPGSIAIVGNPKFDRDTGYVQIDGQSVAVYAVHRSLGLVMDELPLLPRSALIRYSKPLEPSRVVQKLDWGNVLVDVRDASGTAHTFGEGDISVWLRNRFGAFSIPLDPAGANAVPAGRLELRVAGSLAVAEYEREVLVAAGQEQTIRIKMPFACTATRIAARSSRSGLPLNGTYLVESPEGEFRFSLRGSDFVDTVMLPSSACVITLEAHGHRSTKVALEAAAPSGERSVTVTLDYMGD